MAEATDEDRQVALHLLFPELADELPHNLARLQFSDEAEGQVNRTAAALADERATERGRVRAVLDVSPQLVDDSGNLRGYLVSAALAGALLGEALNADLNKALNALAAQDDPT